MANELVRASQYEVSGVSPLGSQDFFGPAQPMRPMGPASRMGRRFDYNTGENLRTTPRQDERLTFWDLVQLAENHDVTRLLIETRKDQMESLSWVIKPRNSTGKEGETPEQQKRIEKTAEFFDYPDGEHSFQTWQRELIEQALVIDATTIYVNKSTPNSTFFEVLDGASIKRVIDEQGRTPLPPSPAYQQIIKGMPAWDYTTEELIYAPRNPRANRLYGCSPVQQIFLTVNIALRRQASILQFFTEGNIPDALIGVPETWTSTQIADAQENWDSLHAGNFGARRHLRFVPGGLKYFPTKEIQLKTEFDEWLARVACFAFNVPPTAFVKQGNRAQAATMQETAISEGLMPLMRWFKQFMNRLIQSPVGLGQHDIEFSYIERGEVDPDARDKIIDRKVRRGQINLNEARAVDGEDPFPGGDVPMIYMGSGPIPVAVAAKQKRMPGDQPPGAGGSGSMPKGNGRPDSLGNPVKRPTTKVGEVGEDGQPPFLY